MRYNAMRCDAMQCNTMQYNTMQYNAIQCNALVRTLNCLRNVLKLALDHGLHPSGNRRKHNVLDPNPEQQIPDWIQQNAERSTPVTRQEIKHYCTSQFEIRNSKFEIPISGAWLICLFFITSMKSST
jgi:hypothetical protein